MSATLDANVLLYATDPESPFNARARAFLEGLPEIESIVYVFWPTIMAFLRIATHPSIFERPLTPDQAAGNVERLLALPTVVARGERESFWIAYRAATEGVIVRGDLVPDAHIVTLMRQYGVRTIYTRNRDYRKFAGIDARDPFA